MLQTFVHPENGAKSLKFAGISPSGPPPTDFQYLRDEYGRNGHSRYGSCSPEQHITAAVVLAARDGLPVLMRRVDARADTARL